MNSTRIATLLLLLLAGAQGVHAQKQFHDRNAVPGNYLVGLYGDDRGGTTEIEFEADQLEFDAFIGISGDSTKVFSGLVVGLDLPRGIEVDGPIRWGSVAGLLQEGILYEGGIAVEFNKDCVRQSGPGPAVLARIHFKVDDDFEEGTVVVRGHVKHGLGVELCEFDGDWWPKPFAQASHLELRRKKSFWRRIQDIFR